MSQKEGSALLTIPEAARELQVADGTVRMALSQGRLSAIKVNGRKMISRCDLDEYIRRTRPSGVKPRGRPVGQSAAVDLQDFLSQVTYEQIVGQLNQPGLARENILLSITQRLREMSGQSLTVVQVVVRALHDQEEAEKVRKQEADMIAEALFGKMGEGMNVGVDGDS